VKEKGIPRQHAKNKTRLSEITVVDFERAPPSVLVYPIRILFRASLDNQAADS
jgi:hypothetical protein